MCRLAAYLGPEAPLSLTLFDLPYPLQRQAHAPRQQRYGHVNVDGTGIAWWPDPEQPPLRYATPGPPWQDPNLGPLARRLVAPAHLAAVRGATPGIPMGAAAVAPFTCGQLAGAHNGWIGGFRGALGQRLAATLPPELYRHYDVASDSLLVFLHVAAAVADGADLAAALVTAIDTVTRACREAGEAAVLTVVVADGRRVAGVRAALDAEPNTLVVRTGQGLLVASEPLDDGPWTEVPPGHLLEATPDGYRVTAL